MLSMKPENFVKIANLYVAVIILQVTNFINRVVFVLCFRERSLYRLFVAFLPAFDFGELSLKANVRKHFLILLELSVPPSIVKD